MESTLFDGSKVSGCRLLTTASGQSRTGRAGEKTTLEKEGGLRKRHWSGLLQSRASDLAYR